MQPRVLRPMEGCSGSILGENEICMHQPLIELGIHSLITAKSLDISSHYHIWEAVKSNMHLMPTNCRLHMYECGFTYMHAEIYIE